MSYIFVHFRETYSVDGEQVYFALSEDGYYWKSVNGGNPVLVATKGDEGVRDISIIRTKNNEFVIMATDLALRRHEADKYGGHIRNAFTRGSKALALWHSKDLIEWSEEALVDLSDNRLGCLWAPGIFYDKRSEDYIIHWSSTSSENNYNGLQIYYSRTKDFITFSRSELLYKKPNSEVLDSFFYYESGRYHLFVKSADYPRAVIHETSKHLIGPYIRDEAFDHQMNLLADKEMYEAPSLFKTRDNKYCLMMDYYGTEDKSKQGYRPFLFDSLDKIELYNASDRFRFPYGLKHGVVLEITEEEYARIEEKYGIDP